MLGAMRSPASDRPRRRASTAARLGALLVMALLLGVSPVGCGGARAPVEATAPGIEGMPAGAPLTLPAILLDPPAPPAFDPFGVNPTVAVAARPTARIAPRSDRIDYRAAWRQLEGGQLPAPDPAGFVDAVADDGPGPLLRSALVPSPWRPGYRCLRVALVPPERPSPAAAVIVIEARRGLIGAAERAALRALFTRADRPGGLGLMVAGERPIWARRPESHGDEARWRAAVDELKLAGPADVPRAIDAARAALPPDGLVVLIADGRPPAPGPVARVAPGPDFVAALGEAITRRLWAADTTLEVEFDPRAVDRYRLVGFDGGQAGGQGAPLWAGRATAALFEVHLVDDTRPLGQIRLRGRLPGGESLVVTAPVTTGLAASAPDERRRADVAALAAAVAEKLRASWWARRIEWRALRAAAEALGPDPAAGRMLWWIDRAAALDRRPDRFAEHGPPDGMDPHRVPILSGVR